MNVFVTGANGFIGSALCSRLLSDNKVIGVDITKQSDESVNIVWEQTHLADRELAATIREKYSPDVVIHYVGVSSDKAFYRSILEFHKSGYRLFDKYSNPSFWFF
jgi:nucleoside-diphosphate-sugar epimerase